MAVPLASNYWASSRGNSRLENLRLPQPTIHVTKEKSNYPLLSGETVKHLNLVAFLIKESEGSKYNTTNERLEAKNQGNDRKTCRNIQWKNW